MKWHKKYTDHLDDPFIHDLIHEFGGNGYMIYYGIIALICKENKKELTGKATFSLSYLRFKFNLKSKTIQNVISYCQECNKFVAVFSENKISFDFPKILEIRDEYSRKSGQAQDKLPPRSKSKSKDTKEGELEIEPPHQNGSPQNKTNPVLVTCIKHYRKKFLGKFNSKPMIESGDLTLLGVIVDQYGKSGTMCLIDDLFSSKDEFICQSSYSIKLFSKVINQLLVGDKPKTGMDAWLERKKREEQEAASDNV